MTTKLGEKLCAFIDTIEVYEQAKKQIEQQERDLDRIKQIKQETGQLEQEAKEITIRHEERKEKIAETIKKLNNLNSLWEEKT